MRIVIEAVMIEELDTFIGAAWGESSPKRKGYRNGIQSYLDFPNRARFLSKPTAHPFQASYGLEPYTSNTMFYRNIFYHYENIFSIFLILLLICGNIFFVRLNSTSSGTLLVPPAAAGKEQGKEARTPRAPAGGLRPPAPRVV